MEGMARPLAGKTIDTKERRLGDVVGEGGRRRRRRASDWITD
jgi:hypothetical protein